MLDYCLRVCYNLLALVVDKPGACTTMQSFLDAFNAWRAAVRPVQPMGFALDFSQEGGGLYGSAILRGEVMSDAELFHLCRAECEAWQVLISRTATPQQVAEVARACTEEQKKLYFGFAFLSGMTSEDILDLTEDGLILRPGFVPVGFDLRAWGDALRNALRYRPLPIEAEPLPSRRKMAAAAVLCCGFLYGVISAVGDVLRLLGE